jgi:hypothetical protein
MANGPMAGQGRSTMAKGLGHKAHALNLVHVATVGDGDARAFLAPMLESEKA